MLSIARDRLARAGIHHCQVRLADIFHLPFATDTPSFDAVLFHQVLHYLDDPLAAIIHAVRVLRPGGRILVADFAPHALEFLRTELAHRRLGFSDAEVAGWFRAAGLSPLSTEAIAPAAAASRDTLTVKIWVAGRNANDLNPTQKDAA
jgi:ArsR family transcriptional regulator